ncbi:MAG: GIY-YIG nuclease family protein [Woeseiaceae bacterium]|nr:GIY-YIG nuclease family protein [Woeseiaceae bacterium]
MPDGSQVPGCYSLYILSCADGSLYTGIALDVSQRLRQHEEGRNGAKYLRGRQPFKLVFEEVIGDRSEASRAEYRLKRLSRADKLSLIAGSVSLSELAVT